MVTLKPSEHKGGQFVRCFHKGGSSYSANSAQLCLLSHAEMVGLKVYGVCVWSKGRTQISDSEKKKKKIPEATMGLTHSSYDSRNLFLKSFLSP